MPDARVRSQSTVVPSSWRREAGSSVDGISTLRRRSGLSAMLSRSLHGVASRLHRGLASRPTATPTARLRADVHVSTRRSRLERRERTV